MRKAIEICALALSVFIAPIVLRASDITYDVNQVVGSGSVTGTITTDGTLGLVGTGDIVDWDLTINDGLASSEFVLTSANSQEEVASSSDLSATASQLFFNFSGGDGGIFLIESTTLGDAGPFVCWETGNSCGSFGMGVSLSADWGERDTVGTTIEGDQVIANAETATPEPGTILLLGSGLLMMVVVYLRRRKLSGVRMTIGNLA